MAELAIYNSMARQKQPFKPLVPGCINLYVCGMTVYDFCHIGHARVMVAFDVMVRFLRAQGWQVNYVRNITDIDDKIIRRAQENGESMQQLTTRYIDAMYEDADRLGCLRPDKSPRATEYIPQMQDMIDRLVQRQLAYAAPEGDVYYSVDSFASYGQLSGRRQEDMLAGASQRVDADGDKKNPFDFVLWKRAKPEEPSWESPWGEGRPGWHIECSAMSTCCLGNHFDIHGGGGDLLFPHHENEIAQSEGATGEKYVNYWMHVGFVNVDGEKMSKSLGNFFTIRDVLEKFDAEVIRFFIISSHYRSPVNFSDAALSEAKNALARLYHALKPVALNPGLQTAEAVSEETRLLLDGFKNSWQEAMLDDFNTAGAIAVLFGLSRELNRMGRDGRTADAMEAARLLVELAQPLGILQRDPRDFLQAQEEESGPDAAYVEQQIALRQQAKQEKNFQLADQIRQALLQQGVVLEDSRNGTSWRRG